MLDSMVTIRHFTASSAARLANEAGAPPTGATPPVTAAAPAAAGRGGGSGGGGAAYLLLVPGAIAAGLGAWQLERRRWKQELLERRQASLKGEPVNVFALHDMPPEYLRVSAAGRYLHDKAQYVGPRPRTVVGGSQIGYLVVTPLYNDDAHRAVMVNRGWVPAQWREDAALRGRGEPQGLVEVEGVVMASEPRSSFVPDNAPAQGQWYWVEAPALAAAAELPADTPLVEAVSAEAAPDVARGTVPSSMDVLAGRGRVAQVEEEFPLRKHVDSFLHFTVMPSDHLNYALTWFALAGATAAMASRAVRGKTVARQRR